MPFLLFWNVFMMSVIGLTNGTSAFYWGWYYYFRFLWHPAFLPHGLGLELLFSHCLLLRAARFDSHGPLEGALPLACFHDQRSPIIIPCMSLWWLNGRFCSALTFSLMSICTQHIHMKWIAFLNYFVVCKLNLNMQYTLCYKSKRCVTLNSFIKNIILMW
jgi:hypothetical protein